jgi:CheY-like chemotaxis protein/nitrogen-specific signal transduction histidine kinase
MAEELARQLGTAIDNAALFEAAREARRVAEESSRAKDEFLAMVSHELRTPLNAILGWTSLILDGALDEDRRLHAMTVIDRNVRAQVVLVEELLEVSRAIAGKLRLHVQTVDVSRVVEGAIDALRPAADAKGLRLTQAIDAATGPITGDPDRIRQVVYNLLTNAVRHTPRGGHVQVTVTRPASCVEIRVDDDGDGMAADLLPHVFERFRQGEAGTTRRHGGLGLGLAIVKHLVELHGGSNHAASEGPGRGASFVVRLPVAPVRPATTPPDSAVLPETRPGGQRPPVADLGGLLVLVVDDDADTRDVLQTTLELANARVITASSADQAFALVEERRPSVVVSDIGMPEQDGYALIERIRRLPEERGGKTPAVALTAFARLEDRTRALLAGFAMHLAKPVDGRELVVVVATVAGRVDRSASMHAPP